MFKGVSAEEYKEEFRIFHYIFSTLIPSGYDIHDLCHEAIEGYFRRGKNTSRQLCCIDALRKRYKRNYKKTVDKNSTPYIPEIHDPEINIESFEDFRDLKNIISLASKSLDAQQCRVLLGFLNGKTSEKIANDLKVSPSRISQIMKAAIKKIRNKISKDLKE
jgi:RNA polymerase sigma factor (sigma-70 family)